MPDGRKDNPWAPTYARILERQGDLILCEQIDQRYRDEAPALPFRWWTVRLTATGAPNWATVQYHRLLIDGLARLRAASERRHDLPGGDERSRGRR